MTKNILILSICMALFAACGTKTETKEEKKDSTSKEEGKSANSTEEKIEAKKLSMEDLAGTWEQTETAQAQGVSASGKLTLILKANGDFIKTVSTATNMPMMGVAPPAISENGKWSLNDKTVSLGGTVKLDYNEDTKTLSNAADGVSLVKK